MVKKSLFYPVVCFLLFCRPPAVLAESRRQPVIVHSVSKHSAYVGEQILATATLISPNHVIQHEFDLPAYEGFWVELLGDYQKADREIDGRLYEVIQRRVVLFPTRPGRITLKPLRVLLTTQSKPLSGRSGLDPNRLLDIFDSESKKTVEVYSKSLELEIKQLPPVPDQIELWGLKQPFTGDLQLAVEYDPAAVAVGAEKTLTVRVVSNANLTRLKRVPLADDATFKFYHSFPELIKHQQDQKLLFERVFKIAVVVSHPCNCRIPGLRLNYFDPASEGYLTAESEDVNFRVFGKTALPERSSEAAAAAQTVKEPENSAAGDISSSIPADESLEGYRDWKYLLWLGLGLGAVAAAGLLILHSRKSLADFIMPRLYFYRCRKAATPATLCRDISGFLSRRYRESILIGNSSSDHLKVYLLRHEQRSEIRLALMLFNDKLISASGSAGAMTEPQFAALKRIAEDIFRLYFGASA